MNLKNLSFLHIKEQLTYYNINQFKTEFILKFITFVTKIYRL